VRTVLFATILWAGWVLPAWAGSYQDFSMGMAASNRGDEDAAIQYLSAALSANDLLPSLRPTAYLNRAQAYANKQRFSDAISDFSAAIRLDPDRVEAHADLAFAYMAVGQTALALAECNAVVNKSHGVSGPCGRLYWIAGKYSEATAAFENEIKFQKSKRTPSPAYTALWLELSRLKTGSADESDFADNVDHLDADAWPKPILDLYLGKTTPEAVAAAAATGDSAAQAGQLCETGFYVGEWQLLHKNVLAAKPLLEKAVGVCPKNFIELAPAVIELNKLK
jgi:lipoprotein NlpI